MRRLAPRPIGEALGGAVPAARPAGLLAEVQSAWPTVAGPALAAAASPVSERAGTVTVACESAVWAHELELLGADLAQRLDEAVSDGHVERLRFIVGSGVNRH
jgi:predicted nucleic acid-binding Zn ribbon protein